MWPGPRELLIRLALASTLVLGIGQLCGTPIVRPLLRPLAMLLPRCDADFTVLSTDIVTQGPGRVVRVRANLSRPILVEGRVVYPFGSGDAPSGGIEVTLTVGGLLQGVDLLLIGVLAWPVANRREGAMRLLLAAPFAAALLLVQFESTLLAELQGILTDPLQHGRTLSSMIWSRFLMGGGGALLALLLASLAIVLGSRCAGRPSAGIQPASRTRSGTTAGCWRASAPSGFRQGSKSAGS